MTAARVLVDMTPLGPGGQNGGAGLVATSLVRNIGALRPEWELVLLIAADAHPEVLQLESTNTRCVLARGPGRKTVTTIAAGAVSRAALQIAPPPLRMKAKDTLWRLRHSSSIAQVVADMQADLLFCPFTAPYYWRRNLPLVAILHDLQHRVFPEFFTGEQRINREKHVQEVCRRADRIVCVSEHVRQTLIAQSPNVAERAIVIPHGVLHTFEGRETGALERLGLTKQGYLLYPANFWPHKNHLRLFAALAQLRQRQNRDIKLICTGAPNEAMRSLQRSADELLGQGGVVLAGYLSEGEFDEVLDGCEALVYPSLYEGFGMPVLEAMARGKPVVCSNVTSLPEVAGPAAVYFDPTSVEDIVRALSVLDDRTQIEDKIRCGRQRAQKFGRAIDMARKYVALFESVLSAA